MGMNMEIKINGIPGGPDIMLQTISVEDLWSAYKLKKTRESTNGQKGSKKKILKPIQLGDLKKTYILLSLYKGMQVSLPAIAEHLEIHNSESHHIESSEYTRRVLITSEAFPLKSDEPFAIFGSASEFLAALRNLCTYIEEYGKYSVGKQFEQSDILPALLCMFAMTGAEVRGIDSSTAELYNGRLLPIKSVHCSISQKMRNEQVLPKVA